MTFNNIELYCQVLGSIMKEPSIISSLPFKISIDDFDKDNKLARIIFYAVSNLIDGGATKIDDITIEAYLQDCPGFLAIYRKERGKDFVGLCLEKGQPESFQAFSLKLKKNALLKDLKVHGYDIAPYDIEATEPGTKEEFDTIYRYENATEEDILAYVEKNFSEIRSRHTNGTSGYRHAADHLDEILEKLENGPELGPELRGALFNSIVRGALRSKMYLRSGGTNVGKAIPNYIKIPMYDGTWKRVDEVREGDYLIGSDGGPTKVIKVHPQEEPKEIYKVVFSDWHVAECCENHLWQYKFEIHGIWKDRVETTAQIYERQLRCGLQKRRDGFPGKGQYRFRVPLVKPVQYKEKEYPIPPYEMGLAAGERKCESLPEEYLIGSVEQRYDFLSGILDIAGIFDKNTGTLSITSANEKKLQQIDQLVRSLGLLCSASNSGNHCRMLKINCKNDYKLKMTKIPGRREIIEKYIKSRAKDFSRDYVGIREIIPTGQFTEMTCFTVDAPDSLFCMDNYTVTHNTRWAVFDACSIVYPIRYSEQRNSFVWAKDKVPQKVLFVTTEMSEEEIQTIILAYVSGVEERKIRYAACSPEEKARVAAAKKIMEKYNDYFFLERISDPNLNNVQTVIKKHILLNDVGYVFYDYIFTSPSLITQFSSNKIRQDVALGMLSNQLKEIATTYNVFIMTGTQVNTDGLKVGEERDQRVLRDSKAIADKADCGFLIAEADPIELEQLEEYIKVYGRPTHVMDIYKIRNGTHKGARIWSKINLGNGERKDLFITDKANKLYTLDAWEFVPSLPGQEVWITDEFLNRINLE